MCVYSCIQLLGVWHVKARTKSGNALSGCAVAVLNGTTPRTYDPSYPRFKFTHVPYLVGQFKLADGRTAVLINNHDDRFNMMTNVIFRNQSYHHRGKDSSTLLLEVSPESGKEEPVHDDCFSCPGLQLLLQAGSGRLLILPDARRFPRE